MTSARQREESCPSPPNVFEARSRFSAPTDNGTFNERSEVVKDFTPECGGINQGDTLRFPKAPRGFPKVDLDTRGE